MFIFTKYYITKSQISYKMIMKIYIQKFKNVNIISNYIIYKIKIIKYNTNK